MEIIRVSHLVKSYPERIFSRKTIKAVEDISFTIQSGEIVGVLGHNGAGKTTTIKILAGLVKREAGNVQIMGLDPEKNYRKIASHLGVLLEGSRNLYLKLTCRENLMYFGRMKGIIDKSKLHRLADELLQFFGLEEAQNRLAGDLSRGMLQKLSLAVTIIDDPEIIILDEPTLGLDIYARRELLNLIQRMAAEKGKTIILTSHMLEIVEQIADRVVIINKGRVVADERVEVLKKFYTQNIIQIIMKGNQKHHLLECLPNIMEIETNEKTEEIKYNLLVEQKNQMFQLMRYIVDNKIDISAIYEKELSLEDVFVLITRGGDVHASKATIGD